MRTRFPEVQTTRRHKENQEDFKMPEVSPKDVQLSDYVGKYATFVFKMTPTEELGTFTQKILDIKELDVGNRKHFIRMFIDDDEEKTRQEAIKFISETQNRLLTTGEILRSQKKPQQVSSFYRDDLSDTVVELIPQHEYDRLYGKK